MCTHTSMFIDLIYSFTCILVDRMLQWLRAQILELDCLDQNLSSVTLGKLLKVFVFQFP